MSIKHSIDTIGNRTRDVEACSAEYETTTVLLHASAFRSQFAGQLAMNYG
jgi:hypothetical protein